MSENPFDDIAAAMARLQGDNVLPFRSTTDTGPPTPDLSAYANEFIDHEPARASAFFAAAELHGRPIPPREWLVQNMIPSGTVTLLGGDGGTGKSLIALQLACACATTGHWLGRGVKTGHAVYLSAEDDTDEIHRRLNDITRAADISIADLDRLSIRSLAGEDAILATVMRESGILRATGLMAEVSAYAQAVEPALIVLDTLADLFAGNENDRAQARQFIGLMRGLAIRNRCAVVVLSHPSRSGLTSGSGDSGSTGWSNSVRSRIYLERVISEGYEPNPDARVLTTKKANYGRAGGEITVTWKDGAFVPEEIEIDPVGGNYKAERVFLKLLALLSETGRKVNHEGGQTYAPNVFAAHPKCEGISKRGFVLAMESHLAEGRITVEIDGPPSKRRQYLVAAK